MCTQHIKSVHSRAFKYISTRGIHFHLLWLSFVFFACTNICTALRKTINYFVIVEVVCCFLVGIVGVSNEIFTIDRYLSINAQAPGSRAEYELSSFGVETAFRK